MKRLFPKICNPLLKLKISNTTTKLTANKGTKIAITDNAVAPKNSSVETTAFPIPPVSAVEDKRVMLINV